MQIGHGKELKTFFKTFENDRLKTQTYKKAIKAMAFYYLVCSKRRCTITLSP